MDLRKEFVLQAVQEGRNIAELCRRYKISRKTGYKWIRRYKLASEPTFADQSKRPKRSPEQTPSLWVKRILGVRKQHPAWGARKIRVVLLRSCQDGRVPASSTIHKILEQEGCILKDEHPQRHWCRFEHEAPNHLWQMDFKGHFEYEQGRCHPLTILDDHSRFSILLKACTQETGGVVKPLLIEVFRRYGMPERINVDNGNPWGSVFAHARYTTLNLWLIRLGIQISHSKPYHPQTNGKEERFHRTLKLEVLRGQYFRSLEHIQHVFDEWREVYNLERPHEGIGMAVPIARYQPSYRRYPEVLPEIEYASGETVKRVDQRGRIQVAGRGIFVGIPFAKEPIALRTQLEPDVFEIFYAHQKLGTVDLSTIQKGELINLYHQSQLSV